MERRERGLPISNCITAQHSQIALWLPVEYGKKGNNSLQQSDHPKPHFHIHITCEKNQSFPHRNKYTSAANIAI
jgi:hypothetical protein